MTVLGAAAAAHSNTNTGASMPAEITEWSSALMTSMAAAMAMFFSAIPKVLGFLVILIAGWFIASLIEKGVAAILRAIRFNELAARAGLSDFVEKMQMSTDPAGMIAWSSSGTCGSSRWWWRSTPSACRRCRSAAAVLMWLPNLIVARCAGDRRPGRGGARNLLRGAAYEGGLANANFLASGVGDVWAFAIVVAVNQNGIATALVKHAVHGFVGASRWAPGWPWPGRARNGGRILHKWYARRRTRVRSRARPTQRIGAPPRTPAVSTTSRSSCAEPADRRHESECGERPCHGERPRPTAWPFSGVRGPGLAPQ